MKYLWHYRLILGVFIPFLVLKSSTILMATYYSFAILLSALLGVVVLFLVSLVFQTQRGRLYSYLILFFTLAYLLNQMINIPYFSMGLDFGEYGILIFPLCLLLNFQQTIPYKEYKDYFFLLLTICILFITISFVREFLGFHKITLFHLGNLQLQIPIDIYLSKIGVNLSNTFFSSPVGGMFIFGIFGVILLHKLKGKYDG